MKMRQSSEHTVMGMHMFGAHMLEFTDPQKDTELY